MSCNPCNGSYVTVEELKASLLGYDFELFTEPELAVYISVAEQMINQYCNRVFGCGEFTEKYETSSDNEGNLLVQTKNKPINEVVSLNLVTAGEASESLDITRLEIFKDAGFAKFPIGKYIPKIIYEIKYKVTEEISAIIKQATIMLVGNILQNEYNKKKGGGADPNKVVKKFTSGEYSEEYFDPSKIEESSDVSSNKYFTPILQAMLNPYKTVNQNFF